MKNFFIGAILFLAVVVQVSFFPNFFSDEAVPDLALLIIVIWTARSSFNAVLKWAIFGGFIMDIASFWPIGINIISFAAVAFVTNSLGKRFMTSQFGWKFFIYSAMVLIATLINFAAVSILSNVTIETEEFRHYFQGFADWSLLQNVGLKVVYNLAVFSIIYWPLERVDKIFSYYNRSIILKK